MAEYAPEAILRLFDAVRAAIPAAVNAGVIGDASHDYGYHRGRDYVGADDYSAQYPQDLAGDGQAACGLDLSWTAEGPQFDVSARLLAAAADPRMYPVREFYGSTDGLDVCGWDYTGGYPVSSDDSHLWHVHLSIHREHANDWAALAPIADVIAGAGSAPAPSPPSSWIGDEPDMIVAQDEQDGRLYIISGNTKLEVPAGGGGDPYSPGRGNLYADLVCSMTGQPSLVALNHDLAMRIPNRTEDGA